VDGSTSPRDHGPGPQAHGNDNAASAAALDAGADRDADHNADHDADSRAEK
jgi:hypothetical protein